MITKNHGPAVKWLSIGGAFYHSGFQSFPRSHTLPIPPPVFILLHSKSETNYRVGREEKQWRALKSQKILGDEAPAADLHS